MKNKSNIKWILPGLAAALVFSGCAYPISRPLRDSAKEINLSAAAENPDAYKGDLVIWGGKIIKTVNREDGTDVYVLGMPLDFQQRPVNEPVTEGRFIARTAQYLDPVLYEAGKSVTIAGAVAGMEKHPVGERQCPYPVLDLKEIHLWKSEVTYVYPGWYGWDPLWYGPPYRGPRFFDEEPGFRFERGEHHEMHEGSERGDKR